MLEIVQIALASCIAGLLDTVEDRRVEGRRVGGRESRVKG